MRMEIVTNTRKEPNMMRTYTYVIIGFGTLLFLILIPNLNSRARKILGVFTPTLNPREHINFLTASSLVKVISEYGFRIRSHSQELPIIDIMWDYVDPETNIIQQIVDLNECYYDIYIIEKIRVNTVEI